MSPEREKYARKHGVKLFDGLVQSDLLDLWIREVFLNL
jgi:hypothetical protein